MSIFRINIPNQKTIYFSDTDNDENNSLNVIKNLFSELNSVNEYNSQVDEIYNSLYGSLSSLLNLHLNSSSKLLDFLKLIEYPIDKYMYLNLDNTSIKDIVEQMLVLADKIFEKQSFLKNNDFWFKYQVYFYLEKNGLDDYLAKDEGLECIKSDDELEQFYNENRKKVLELILKNQKMSLSDKFINILPKPFLDTFKNYIALFKDKDEFEMFKIYVKFNKVKENIV